MNKTHTDRVDYLAAVAGAIVQGGPLQAQCDVEGLQVEMLAPIEDEAPKRQATTATGALFQLLLARGDLDMLVETDWDADALRKYHLRIQGCVHSAINFFEREHGLDRDALGGVYYARRSYVPEIWRDGARERM